MEYKFNKAASMYKEKLLDKFGDRVEKIIYFGPCVDPLLRKQWGYDDIIDCAVVLAGNILRDKDAAVAARIAADLSGRAGQGHVIVSPLVMSSAEFKKEVHAVQIFRKMISSGVTLYDRQKALEETERRREASMELGL